MPTTQLTSHVLAERYASETMQQIWSPTTRVVLERDLWIAILKAQRDLGVDIPEEAITAYEQVKEQVDVEAIRECERLTRHDVKARIDIFCDLAGHQHIHKGMTSRDLTETIEQLQIIRSLRYLRVKAVAAVIAFSARTHQYRDWALTARTHNVPAQLTTLGKRLAMFGEEMLIGLERLDRLVENYPLRGLKGAVGTQLDQLTLFEGNSDKVKQLEERILDYLGCSQALGAVGQIYPRSLDFEVISTLVQLSSAPSSFAKTLRLMAGHELAGEGQAPGQVGSSAMPHKINCRSCERLNGLAVILKGHLTMAAHLAGDQWNEGDVACSVVRRVMLPDSCFAIDGLLDTLLTVLQQMEVYPASLERENQHYLPFLSTTTFLMEAVKSGVGRETAHEAIREHALAASQTLRSGKQNDLIERLAADSRLELSRERLESLLSHCQQQTGLAAAQVEQFVEKVDPWRRRYPEAADYQPPVML